jgi:DNA-binding NarL/FixJ family response regulator
MSARVPVVIARGEPGLLDEVHDRLPREDFEVVDKALSGDEALDVLGRRRAGVVLLDLQIPDALAYLARIRAAAPDAVVVAVSAGGRENEIRDALAAGAAACVLKSAQPDDVVTAIRQAQHQSVFFSREAATGSAPAERLRLTVREVEVLRLVSEGLSNAEVARRLWITEQTVKFHLSNIYRKLGVTNRTQATRVAELHGLVSSGRPRSPSSRRQAGY